MQKFNGKIVLLAIVALFVFGNIANAITVKEIMNKLDDLMDQRSDISAKVSMTQKKVGQGTKNIESFYYRRDSDDSFLIIMTAPATDKGNGYLRVGDNFWMYRRNTRTFQHINRDENIGGTDMKGGDFEKRKMTELYAPVKKDGEENLSETMLGKIPVYRFEIKAIVNDVTYPKQIYWVRKDNFLPLKVQSFSLSGTLMQTSYYLKYTTIEGKYVMLKGIFIDEFEKGNKTIMNLSGISVKKLSDHIFTKAYLESLSK